MDDEHYYSVFCTIRFRNSIRSSKAFLENIDKLRKMQTGEDYESIHPYL